MAEHDAYLKVARQMVDSGDPRYLYMACWLARQGLELMVDQLIDLIDPSAGHASTRSKLAILLVIFDGTAVPGRAVRAWEELSYACHLPAYELTPTPPEVNDWLEDVKAVSDLCSKLG
ncbi:hypothetical protein GCM10027418_07180 [Mariniluteicoccus endophyticus]